MMIEAVLLHHSVTVELKMEKWQILVTQIWYACCYADADGKTLVPVIRYQVFLSEAKGISRNSIGRERVWPVKHSAIISRPPQQQQDIGVSDAILVEAFVWLTTHPFEPF